MQFLMLAMELGQLVDAGLDILIYLLATVIASAVVALARKYGVEIDRKKTKQTIVDVLNFVEEKAKVSEKLGRKMPSGEKLELATTKLVDRIPGISREEAEFLVESHLRPTGLGAAGGFLAGVSEAIDDNDDAPEVVVSDGDDAA